MFLWAKEYLFPEIQLIVFIGPFLLSIVADMFSSYIYIYIFTNRFLPLRLFSAILEPLVRYKDINAIMKNIL